MKDWLLDRWDELVCLIVNTRDGIHWWVLIAEAKGLRWIARGFAGLSPAMAARLEAMYVDMNETIVEMERDFAEWKQS